MVKRWFAIVLTLVLASSLVVGCGGVSQEDLDAALADLAAAESDLTAAESALTAAESDLTATESDLAAAESDLTAAESALATAEAEVVALTEALDFAPVILNVAVSDIADLSATVTWETHIAADSQVEYGATTSYGLETTLSTALVSAHSVGLTGLSADTTYYYQVKSGDAVSDQGTFSTIRDIAAVTLLWESGDHNNMEYLLTYGTDTHCARCHSPVNWDPAAMQAGPAGGCFNHKGPGAGPVWRTMTLGNDAIPNADLAPIGCTTCHEAGHGPDLATWNNITQGYDAAATSEELCALRCHGPSWGLNVAVASPSDKDGDSGTADGGGTATSLTDATQDFTTTVAVGMTVFNITDNSLAEVTAVNSDTALTTTALTARPYRDESGIPGLTYEEGDKYQIYQGPLIPGAITDGTTHLIISNGSAHPNEIGIADPLPWACVDCHETHSLEADCTDCHTGLTTANGHNATHIKVTCEGCHSGDPDLDALGWADDELKDSFTIGSMTTPRGGGDPSFSAGFTHTINRSGKACADCHSEGNDWGLSVQE